MKVYGVYDNGCFDNWFMGQIFATVELAKAWVEKEYKYYEESTHYIKDGQIVIEKKMIDRGYEWELDTYCHPSLNDQQTYSIHAFDVQEKI